MKYHEVSGSFYKLGFEIGKTHKELIDYAIRSYATFHAPLSKPGPCKQLTEMLKIAERFPWAINEMRGIADGADIPFEKVAFLNFLGFGGLLRPGISSCSNIVFTDSDRGPLLAGNCDDTPIFHLVSFIPDQGCAYTIVRWAGTLLSWSGMNQYGLAVSGSSAGSIEETPNGSIVRIGNSTLDEVLMRYLVETIILQEARNTKEAIEILLRPDMPGRGNHIIVDASGHAVVVEKVRFEHYGTREAQNGWVACGNLLLKDISKYDSSKDKGIASSISRYKSLDRCGNGPHTFEAAARVLRSHDGGPSEKGSVCNDGTACSAIFLPAEGKVYFTQRYACQYDFEVYSVPRWRQQ